MSLALLEYSLAASIMPPACVTWLVLPGRRRPNICALMVPAIGWTCAWRVNDSVRVVLGINCSCGIISVNARAVPPYDNNAHPRILPRVFWSTVFSLVADTVPYREISIMQGRDNDNYSDLSSRSCFNSNPKMRLPALTLTPSLLVNKPPLSAPTPQ